MPADGKTQIYFVVKFQMANLFQFEFVLRDLNIRFGHFFLGGGVSLSVRTVRTFSQPYHTYLTPYKEATLRAAKACAPVLCIRLHAVVCRFSHCTILF